MIATILPSTPTFHAVMYNEKKVAEGSARLLEIKNFGQIDQLGYSEPEELQQYLIDYSSQNSRVKNPQFHLAISCKGNEWSHEELLDFAHQYLNEMGYGDPDQPMLIYAHHDTDNNHIHIVTSRIDPKGKKINDSKERVRSQKVLEKLLKQDLKKKAEKDIEDAKKFDFSDNQQFKSILEAMGYECFEKNSWSSDPVLFVKKGGVIQAKISIDEIKQIADKNNFKRRPDVSDRMKWRAIFKKYRDLNSERKGLEKDLRDNFGLALVWQGKKDEPFDYNVVDFNNKKVYTGYKILYIKDLLDFKTKEEHIKEISLLIDKCLREYPYITTKELNKHLKKVGGYVKKNYFGFGNTKIPLDELVVNTLSRNNKIAFRQSFHPSSQKEIDIICMFTGFPHPNLLTVEQQVPDVRYKDKEVALLFRLLINKGTEEKKRDFDAAGYRIIKSDEGIFILNFSNKTILDMEKTDIPESLYSDLIPVKQPTEVRSQPTEVRSKTETTNKPQVRKPNLSKGIGGSGGQNREWEVGKHGLDPDDPDRQRGLNY